MNLLPCVLVLHELFVDPHMIKVGVRQNASLYAQYPQTHVQHVSDKQWGQRLEYM